MNKIFASWLKQELKKRDWSIREFSRRSSISHSSVARAVKGDEPSWETCAQIAYVLDVSPVEVFIISGKLKTKEKIETSSNFLKKESEHYKLSPTSLQIARELNDLSPKFQKVVFNIVKALLIEINKLNKKA